MNLHTGGEVNPPGNEKNYELLKTQALNNQLDFLNHPFYKQNAKNVWGDDSETHIASQIDRMRNTPVFFENNLDQYNAAGLFSPPSMSSDWDNEASPYGKIRIATDSPNSGILHSLEHEYGHSSDTGGKSHWFDYNDPTRTYIEDEEGNVIQKGKESPLARMFEEYRDYEKIKLNSDYHNSDWYKDYLAMPTEFRTRLNHVKKLMANDNFNWNEKSGDEISKYIENKIVNPDESETLSAAELKELEQFAGYNQETIDLYTDRSDYYNEFLDKKNRKGKDGEYYRKLWRQGVRTPEDFIEKSNRFKYYEEEEKKTTVRR